MIIRNRLVSAIRDLKAGTAGSVLNLLKSYPLIHTVDINERLLQAPCEALLHQFFKDENFFIILSYVETLQYSLPLQIDFYIIS